MAMVPGKYSLAAIGRRKNKNPELMLGVFADLIESGFNAYQNR